MHFDEFAGAVRLARVDLLDAADACPADRRSISPGEDRWSVCDVLDHIEHADARMVDLLRRLVERAARHGRLVARRMADVPVSFDYRAAIPVYNAVPAFPQTDPSGRSETVIRNSLSRLDSEFQDVMETAETHDCTALVAPHPIGRLNFYEWIYLRAEHDKLHTEQIRTILADLL